jgi:methylase of polypeptide subunit release factors
MINLWYNSDEVTGFHPVVENAIKNAITNCGFDSVMELVHHPAIPNSTIIPDFAIKLKSSNRYIFVIEVKKTARDVTSQRFQNQSRSYVSDFSPYWEPNYPKYFCLTNIEELILFAERQGPISTCILKGNPKSHTSFNPQNRDATQTSIEFQATFEQILQIIYNRTQPDWDNNWQPIIDTFVQNYQSVSNSLTLNKDLADEVTLYEFFRLLAFAYLKDYYNQTSNPNQSFFRTFPLANDNLQTFITKLANNYNRVLQLDFNQVFSNHPNSNDRIFPENLSASIIQYFKNTIQALNSYSSQAVSDNPLPEYIFNLLTSKVYDKNTLHKKGKIMSDTELSILLATVTIENENSTVIDPCSGDGALLDAAYDFLNILNLSSAITKSHNQLLNQVSGIEIDPFLAQLATFRLVSKNLSGVNNTTNANIIAGNTFSNPNSSGFDVLLMNPPFLRNDNPDAPITIADKALMNNAINSNGQTNFVNLASQPNLYFYFVNYSWHYLNSQGRAGLILMATFLNNKDGEFLKQFLLDKVESIILYPRNYFEDFKVTTVIVVLSKQPSTNIKFLRVINSDLLSRPNDIKALLSNSVNTVVTSDYSLKVTDRQISSSDNWKLFFNDPENKYEKLNTLTFFEPLNTFFSTKKRGGAGNSGESTTLFPNLSKTSFALSNIGFGLKNSKAKRSLILTQNDLNIEKALHFPESFDDNENNGLKSRFNNDLSLKNLFDTKSRSDKSKWRKIVNETFNAKVEFDILLPRNERTKQSCYYNPFSSQVVVSTNFFYYQGLINENTTFSKETQLKFITAFINSCFGQIQLEIHSNNREGTRKLEGEHLNMVKIIDIKKVSRIEAESVVRAFESLNNLNVSVSGDEGLSTPRRQLDEEVAKIIFSKNNLGFNSSTEMTNFFELFLADLVEDRRL